jgi:hypothetical protein
MENFIEQAKTLGFEKGQAVGFEKGQISLISTMFNNGMNLSNISKITEIPVEKLEEMVASKSK